MKTSRGLSRRLFPVGVSGVAGVALGAVILHWTLAPPTVAGPIDLIDPGTTSPAAPATTSIPAPVVAPPPPTGARQAATNAAASYAQNLGWRTGIAVVDTKTGQLTTAGNATDMFPTESTVKVLLAANLLANGEATGAVATTAEQMVAASDDDAADALYELAGGDEVVSWAATRYTIPGLGTPPVDGAGQWGSTQVSPKGMATFLADAANDPTIGPWLMSAMAQMTSIADDGTNQDFGLKVADPQAEVKQGWGGDVPGMDAESTPSIGFVNGGRYAVAIYTIHSPLVAQSTAAAVVTHQAELLMPDGRVPAL